MSVHSFNEGLGHCWLFSGRPYFVNLVCIFVFSNDRKVRRKKSLYYSVSFINYNIYNISQVVNNKTVKISVTD